MISYFLNLQVPPTLKFVMDGEMPDYLLAKDLILQVSLLGSDAFVSFKLPQTHLRILTFIFCINCVMFIVTLQIIGEISVAGATYKSMEFAGTTVESLTVSNLCIYSRAVFGPPGSTCAS